MVQTEKTTERHVGAAADKRRRPASPKWAARVNDVTVPMPQQRVPVTVLRSQAAIDDDFALVRDHNSPNDPVIDNAATVDLADGNVFYTVRHDDAKGLGTCNAPPKLAYFVDDRAEVTTNGEQSGRTIRELFSLAAAGRLVRDYESPVDEPVGIEDSASIADGPVFFTRQAPSVMVIVNGKRRRTTSFELTFAGLIQLAFDPPPSGENICFTVTYRGGPCSNPEGSLVEGQSVEITERMVFNVTATDKS